jgi:AcrR family transcriptional regulator
VDAAVTQAALRLLRQGGAEAVTFEAVAKLAKVGRPSLYRRWRTPTELLADAFEAARPEAEPLADRGSLARDLEPVLAAFLAAGEEPTQRELLALALSAATRDPKLARRYFREHLAPRRAALLPVLERARARGELGSHVDLELLLDVLGGAWAYQVFVCGKRASARELTAALELVLTGARPLASRARPRRR